jgi:hypothetical protein
MRPENPDGKQDSRQDGEEAGTLALMALAWTLNDERRADRLLALTGLDADALRAGVGNPAVLRAVLEFLSDHEPDLIACAEALDIEPAALIAAGQELGR